MFKCAPRCLLRPRERGNLFQPAVNSQRWRMLTLLTCLAMWSTTPCTQGVGQDSAYARRLYFEKANCDYCHGWAGDGAGQGQAPAGANLRETRLNRDQLVMVISCGLAG